MTELDADPWLGQVLHGIELLELSGAGRTARVYRGVHQALFEPRAVKIILEDLEEDPATKERFLREARAVRGLSHKNIVQILDAGRTNDGHGFLVLEWLEGAGLDRIIAAQAPISPRRTSKILIQLLSALEAAHAAGLVHRDLKPANVMVAEDREANTETVKLIDFGLVRTPGSALTGAGRWVGTPAYLAPEVELGDPASPRSDLYAVGVIAYELLSGKLPYADDGAARRTAPPPPLPTTSGLESIVLSLLAPEPSVRPADARTVREAIEALDFSRDAELDTLVAPTPLDGNEEALSTATDPGRKPQAVLRIETRVTPEKANLRRSVGLVAVAFALSVAAFVLGQRMPPGRPKVAPPAALGPAPNPTAPGVIERPGALPSAPALPPTTKGSNAPASSAPDPGPETKTSLPPDEAAFHLLRRAVALKSRRPDLTRQLDPLILRLSQEAGALSPDLARLQELTGALEKLER